MPPQAITIACGCTWWTTSGATTTAAAPRRGRCRRRRRAARRRAWPSTSARRRVDLRAASGRARRARRAAGSRPRAARGCRPPAAASAAARPATPAPMTSTSGCRFARSRSRGRSAGSAKPRPATLRMIFSAIGHANFGSRHRLVVEADGHRPVHLVEDVQRVPVGRRPRVLAHRPSGRRCAAHSHARTSTSPSTVTRQLGQSPDDAVQAARAVVLEGAREGADAAAVEGRGDRVARPQRYLVALEVDRTSGGDLAALARVLLARLRQHHVGARVADDRVPAARAVRCGTSARAGRRTRCAAARGGRSPPPPTRPGRTAGGPHRRTRTRRPDAARTASECGSGSQGSRVRGRWRPCIVESPHTAKGSTVEPPACVGACAGRYDPTRPRGRGRRAGSRIRQKRRERHEVEPGDRPGAPAPAHRRHRTGGRARGRRDRAVRPLQGQDRAERAGAAEGPARTRRSSTSRRSRPTPAGEGKTTTSVSLTQGLGVIGKKPVLALREPSLGPDLRHQGRRGRRRLRAGRADGGPEPPLHRRHPRDHGRQQPAGGLRRRAPAARPRAEARPARRSPGAASSTSTTATCATSSRASAASSTASRARRASTSRPPPRSWRSWPWRRDLQDLRAAARRDHGRPRRTTASR